MPWGTDRSRNEVRGFLWAGPSQQGHSELDASSRPQLRWSQAASTPATAGPGFIALSPS